MSKLRSYRRLALKFHPSRNKEAGSAEKFLELGEAYDVLSDRAWIIYFFCLRTHVGWWLKRVHSLHFSWTSLQLPYKIFISYIVSNHFIVFWQFEKRPHMTSLAKKVLKGESLPSSALRPGHGHLLMSTMATLRKPLDSFSEVTTLLQVTMGVTIIMPIYCLIQLFKKCPPLVQPLRFLHKWVTPSVWWPAARSDQEPRPSHRERPAPVLRWPFPRMLKEDQNIPQGLHSSKIKLIFFFLFQASFSPDPWPSYQ